MLPQEVYSYIPVDMVHMPEQSFSSSELDGFRDVLSLPSATLFLSNRIRILSLSAFTIQLPPSISPGGGKQYPSMSALHPSGHFHQPLLRLCCCFPFLQAMSVHSAPHSRHRSLPLALLIYLIFALLSDGEGISRVPLSLRFSRPYVTFLIFAEKR